MKIPSVRNTLNCSTGFALFGWRKSRHNNTFTHTYTHTHTMLPLSGSLAMYSCRFHSKDWVFGYYYYLESEYTRAKPISVLPLHLYLLKLLVNNMKISFGTHLARIMSAFRQQCIVWKTFRWIKPYTSLSLWPGTCVCVCVYECVSMCVWSGENMTMTICGIRLKNYYILGYNNTISHLSTGCFFLSLVQTSGRARRQTNKQTNKQTSPS